MSESRRQPHNPWLSVAIVCLAQLMVVLDATVVNVALPSIQHGLRISNANLQWEVSCCSVAASLTSSAAAGCSSSASACSPLPL